MILSLYKNKLNALHFWRLSCSQKPVLQHLPYLAFQLQPITCVPASAIFGVSTSIFGVSAAARNLCCSICHIWHLSCSQSPVFQHLLYLASQLRYLASQLQPITCIPLSSHIWRGIRTDPAVHADPAVRGDPAVYADPAVRGDPAVRSNPGARSSPGVRCDPGARGDPGQSPAKFAY